MNEDDFSSMLIDLTSVAEKVKSNEKEYRAVVSAIEILKKQRSDILSFKEVVANKVYETIYNRGGWKSDCQAAAEAIRSVKFFDEQ